MVAKNRLVLSCLAISLFVLLSLTNVSADFSVKKHVVAYAFHFQENLEFIASNFNLIDTEFYQTDNVQKIKLLNPDVIVIGYRSPMTMYECYEDWVEVNSHEDWFIHDEFGHRLQHDKYGWYLMDVGNDGWRNRYANYVKEKLDNSVFDGVFADDVWAKLYQFHKFHAVIVNEISTVNNDGVTVTTMYPLWEGPFYRCKNEIGVWTNPEHTGINYYTGGNFCDHTITLGTPLPPGTTVYVNYSAKDKDLFKPPQEKIDSWHDDMKGMLKIVKATIGDKLFIINNNDNDDFLDIVDGIMDESFIHATWHSSDHIYSPSEWKKDVDGMIAALAKGKIFLAQSGTKGDASEEEIKKIMFYCFTSYLLGMDETSTFYFQNPNDKDKATYYPEWDISLGPPIGKYYLLADRPSNNIKLVQNPSFEYGLDGWLVDSWQGKVIVNVDESNYKEGTKSIQLTSDGNNYGGIYQTISLKPNTTYTFSGWIKTDNLLGYDYKPAQIYLVESEGGPVHRIGLGGTGKISNEDWTYVCETFTTGDDISGAYIGIAFFGAEGVAWFDDIRIEEGIKVYARDFENGKVLVNTTYGRCTIDLDKPYKTLEGEIVNSVNIGPHEGVILENITYEYSELNHTEIHGCSQPSSNPTLEILANGSDSPITLRQADTLTLTISLKNNGITNNADWWLAKDTPSGLYFFTFEGWTTDWVPGYQGPLFHLDSFEVLNVPASEFPVGTYTFYFCIDTNMDNNITWDSLYCDSIVVNVTE